MKNVARGVAMPELGHDVCLRFVPEDFPEMVEAIGPDWFRIAYDECDRVSLAYIEPALRIGGKRMVSEPFRAFSASMPIGMLTAPHTVEALVDFVKWRDKILNPIEYQSRPISLSEVMMVPLDQLAKRVLTAIFYAVAHKSYQDFVRDLGEAVQQAEHATSAA